MDARSALVRRRHWNEMKVTFWRCDERVQRGFVVQPFLGVVATATTADQQAESYYCSYEGDDAIHNNSNQQGVAC